MKHSARVEAFMLLLPVLAVASISHAAIARSIARPISAKIHGAARAGAPPRVPQGYLGVDLRDVNQDEVTPLRLNDTRGLFFGRKSGSFMKTPFGRC